jgi:hypothetical protein
MTLPSSPVFDINYCHHRCESHSIYRKKNSPYQIKKPALCNSYLEVKFINTAPGAPLSDLIELLPFTPRGVEPISLDFTCKTMVHCGELSMFPMAPEDN